MKPVFTVCKTFCVVSVESAKRGDYSDHGYEFERRAMTLKEVISEVNQLGTFENFRPESASQDLYGVDVDRCYQSGDETTYALHIEGAARHMKRLNRILKGVK